MTVVVAFLCSDGAVVGVDSMITPSLGAINVGHHKGRKVEILAGEQIYAFAGDQGQAHRFKILAEGNHQFSSQAAHPLDYPIALTSSLITQFVSTGINNSVNVNTVLVFLHGGARTCCVFEGAMQPRLLDEHHYYVALGSGKLSADPFLRFLADIFCDGPPTVREAVFLTTWAIQHVIDTNPGGVAGPIRIAVSENAGAGFHARELPPEEISEHVEAVASAAGALREWRAKVGTGAANEEIPAPPQAPLPEI